MKVLSVIAQKPSSTGSGIYLTELVRCMSELNIEQEVICAAYADDNINDYNKVIYNRILFNTKDLPIKIAGMSDVMPYDTIRYSDFVTDIESLKLWTKAFESKIDEVINNFKPDLIICHHLYLLTAIVVSKLCNKNFSYECCNNYY